MIQQRFNVSRALVTIRHSELKFPSCDSSMIGRFRRTCKRGGGGPLRVVITVYREETSGGDLPEQARQSATTAADRGRR